ncbi:hypothetical protein INR49_007578 [Caranx melampygus]|nr:hypothetical protein INR49_007578 [Caranx melampygus]
MTPFSRTNQRGCQPEDRKPNVTEEVFGAGLQLQRSLDEDVVMQQIKLSQPNMSLRWYFSYIN